MAKRLLVGKANDGSSDIYGLWISKPAITDGFDGNVINGSGVLCDQEDMLFDSRKGKHGMILGSGTGTGSGQTVTVPAGKRTMMFLVPDKSDMGGTSLSSAGTVPTATQTLSGTTMTVTVTSGKKWIVTNIEAD